jgi:hypothetical protein
MENAEARKWIKTRAGIMAERMLRAMLNRERIEGVKFEVMDL